MHRLMIIVWFVLGTLTPWTLPAQAAPSPPANPERLVFIHHSTGGNWLADDHGGLGTALMNNNYYVSATNYDWGPDSIGSRTDIPDWPEWFTGENRDTILAALFSESGQNIGGFGDWSRPATSPGGENRIVMFKSCFPNSNLDGKPTDPPAPEVGYDYTVANAKAVYNSLRSFFQTRPDKLFIVITAPPLRAADTTMSRAANARAFNSWLVHDWLDGYPLSNVAVFDYFNVLTAADNHHRWHDAAVEHVVGTATDTLFYPSGDSHPNPAGQQKAAAEFVPLLNHWVGQWEGGGGPDPATRLYFPHVASNGLWETEVCLVDKGSGTNGTLTALSDAGQTVDTMGIQIPPRGRKELVVGAAFSSPSTIGYLRFDTASAASDIAGYLKFSIPGQYRVAVPATSDLAGPDIPIPHIASSAQWWTGISLVNTTSGSKSVDLEFDDGSSRSVTLGPGQHQGFSIRSLFGGTAMPGLHSGLIRNTDGMVGLELFGSMGATPGTSLSGILFQGNPAQAMVCPHVAEDTHWWTGLVATNTSDDAADLTVSPYRADGTALSPISVQLEPDSQYLGSISGLGLPADTAWLSLSCTHPLAGLELFGTCDGTMLAGYSGMAQGALEGVFPRIDPDGWTGLVLVNPNSFPVTVTLTTHDDEGVALEEQTLILGPHQKQVGTAEVLMGSDLGAATHLRYSATAVLVGFQMNGSSDGAMLDALPAL